MEVPHLTESTLYVIDMDFYVVLECTVKIHKYYTCTSTGQTSEIPQKQEMILTSRNHLDASVKWAAKI